MTEGAAVIPNRGVVFQAALTAAPMASQLSLVEEYLEEKAEAP